MSGQQIVQAVSNGLIALGVFIGLITGVNVLLDAQHVSVSQAEAPFDQVAASSESETGFVPYVFPAVQVGVPALAPTLPPSFVGMNGATQTAPPPSTKQTALLGGEILPTTTPAPIWLPDRFVIPALQLEAPVWFATLKAIEYQGIIYQQWVAPSAFAAGWLTTSAPLGVAGNTVFIGHGSFNGNPKVFAHLADLEVGDVMQVYARDKAFAYRIALKMILPERFQTLEVRLKNAQWIEPSLDERLTLVTCWPYGSNTHRLIIVAIPIPLESFENAVMTPRLTPLPPLNWNPLLPMTEPQPEPSATSTP